MLLTTVWIIMEKYSNIISPHFNPDAENLNVFHKICNPPIFSKPQQLFDIVEEEFRKLQKAAISPSKLEWSSALHIVPKSDYAKVG